MLYGYGGIPYYLSMMDKSKSLAQNIDQLFFADNAELKDEFNDLYRALFKKSAARIPPWLQPCYQRNGYDPPGTGQGIGRKEITEPSLLRYWENLNNADSFSSV